MKVVVQTIITISAVIFVCCNSPDSRPAIHSADNLGKMSHEVDRLEKLIEQYPDSLSFRQQLVMELEKKGDLAGALKQQIWLSQKDSLDAMTHYRLSELQLQRGDTVSGLQSLRKSIRLAPEFAEAKLEMGFIYADQRSNIALQIADDVLKTTANPALLSQARYLKAIFFSNINDKNKALKQLDECIVNDYTFLDAHIEKGIILYDLKRYAEAMKAFEKVQIISNVHAETYYWIGKCYEAMNKKEEAIDFYKKTLGLDENFEDARTALSRLNN